MGELAEADDRPAYVEATPGALDRMGSRMRDRLGPEVPIDDVLTPAAHRAIGDLDRLPGLFGLAPGEGPDLQQVDQLRKRLVAYRGNTGQNPTDRRAMDQILAHFDGHVHDAMDAGLFGQRAKATMAAVRAASSSTTTACLRWVERCWLRTRQAKRSDTPCSATT